MTIELGGNITLSGFGDMEFTEMIVVKKLVGQYARKLSDTSGLEHLKVTHKSIGASKAEIHVQAGIKHEEITASVTNHNLYIALDSALKKVHQQAAQL